VSTTLLAIDLPSATPLDFQTLDALIQADVGLQQAKADIARVDIERKQKFERWVELLRKQQPVPAETLGGGTGRAFLHNL
jgi:hypothetical protein